MSQRQWDTLTLPPHALSAHSMLSATYLDVTRAPVEIQVQVLDFAVFAKEFRQILLASFLMHVCHDDDPAFDGANCDSVCGGSRVAVVLPCRRW